MAEAARLKETQRHRLTHGTTAIPPPSSSSSPRSTHGRSDTRDHESAPHRHKPRRQPRPPLQSSPQLGPPPPKSQQEHPAHRHRRATHSPYRRQASPQSPSAERAIGGRGARYETRLSAGAPESAVTNAAVDDVSSAQARELEAQFSQAHRGEGSDRNVHFLHARAAAYV